MSLKQNYEDDGYCRIENFIPLSFIHDYANDINWLVETQLEQLNIPPSIHADPVKRLSNSFIKLWEAKPEAQTWIYDEINRRPWMYALASDPNLNARVKEMLGTDHIAIHPRLNIVMNMPNQNWHVADWHQDRYYGASNHIIAYIPMQPTGDFNGGLIVAPQAHQNGLLPHVKNSSRIETKWHTHPNEVVDTFNQVQLELDAGDLILFDGWLPHAAKTNTSDHVRFVITIRYANLSDPFFIQRGWVWKDLAEEGLTALQKKEK